MESKKAKYLRLRPNLGEAGILLTMNNKIVSKVIRNCDNDADFSHVGIYYFFKNCYFVIDANAKGVAPALLSTRINECNDFCFIRPKALHPQSLEFAFRNADKGIRYDYWNGLKELYNRKFDKNLKINKSNGMDICSDYVSEFALMNQMFTQEFIYLRLAFPQDYIRFVNELKADILR